MSQDGQLSNLSWERNYTLLIRILRMRKEIKIIVFSLLSLAAIACSSKSSEYKSLADSLNSRCPVMLMDGEVELTKISYSAGLFHVDLTLCDEAPISVAGLQALNDEHSRLVKEIEGSDEIERDIGGRVFLYGVISESPMLAQMIDSLALATSTPESTQGYVPIEISVCDATDTICYKYNEDIEKPDKRKWLTAIMPMEMQNAFGFVGDGEMPELNEEVKFNGIPSISEDGYLTVHCSYDAMPYFRDLHKPMRLSDIKGKYFSVTILMNHLKAMKKNPVGRFLKACAKRNVGMRFSLTGEKDGIDPDMVSPQEVKEWKSWGGDDTIVISAQQLRSLYDN